MAKKTTKLQLDELMNALHGNGDLVQVLGDISSCPPREAAKYPIKYRIIAQAFLNNDEAHDLNWVQAMLKRNHEPELYSRNFWDATLIYALDGTHHERLTYDEWKQFVHECSYDLDIHPAWSIKSESGGSSRTYFCFADLKNYLKEESVQSQSNEYFQTYYASVNTQEKLRNLQSRGEAIQYIRNNFAEYCVIREKTRYYFIKYLYYYLETYINEYSSYYLKYGAPTGNDEEYALQKSPENILKSTSKSFPRVQLIKADNYVETALKQLERELQKEIKDGAALSQREMDERRLACIRSVVETSHLSAPNIIFEFKWFYALDTFYYTNSAGWLDVIIDGLYMPIFGKCSDRSETDIRDDIRKTLEEEEKQAADEEWRLARDISEQDINSVLDDRNEFIETVRTAYSLSKGINNPKEVDEKELFAEIDKAIDTLDKYESQDNQGGRYGIEKLIREILSGEKEVDRTSLLAFVTFFAKLSNTIPEQDILSDQRLNVILRACDFSELSSGGDGWDEFLSDLITVDMPLTFNSEELDTLTLSGKDFYLFKLYKKSDVEDIRLQ